MALERLGEIWPVGEIDLNRAVFLENLGDDQAATAARRAAVSQPFLLSALRNFAVQSLAVAGANRSSKVLGGFSSAMEAYEQAAQFGPIGRGPAALGVVRATEVGETEFARWLMRFIPKNEILRAGFAAYIEERNENFGAAWKHIRGKPVVESDAQTNRILHNAAWLDSRVRKMRMGMLDDAQKRLADFEKRAGEAAAVTPADHQFVKEVMHYRIMLDQLGFDSESRAMRERLRAAIQAWVLREIEKGDPKAPARRIAEEFADAWVASSEGAEAELALREFLKLQSQRHPEDVRIPHVEARLGEMLVKQRRYSEAEPFLFRALPLIEMEGSLSPRATADLCRNFVRVYARTGRETEAAQWRSRVVTVLKANKDLESKAEPMKKLVAAARSKPGTPALDGELWKVFGFYMAEQRYEEAELWGREGVSIREKMQRDKWWTSKSKAELGRCLLAQERHAEAEPLLVAGCAGMLLRHELMPAVSRHALGDNIQALIRLYDDTGRSDQAAEWRSRLWEIPQPAAKKE